MLDGGGEQALRFPQNVLGFDEIGEYGHVCLRRRGYPQLAYDLRLVKL